MNEMPFGNQLDAALHSFNRHAIDKLKRGFVDFMKEALSTSTDIFFRRCIGERAFTAMSFGYGIIFWLGATALSSFITYWFVAAFTRSGFCRTWSWTAPLVAGLGVSIGFFRLALKNEKDMKAIREAKKPYHSRSRGQRRFPDTSRVLVYKLAFLAGLLFLSPIVGIAFIASMATSGWLQAEQQQRLLNEYWDRKDHEVSEDFLESAIVGDTAPEITQLYESLPEKKYDRSTREEIAKANVGKPIRIVATPPGSTRRKQSAQSAAQKTAAASEAPAAGASPHASPPPESPSVVEKPAGSSNEIPSAHGGKGWKLGVIILATSIAAYAIFKFNHRSTEGDLARNSAAVTSAPIASIHTPAIAPDTPGPAVSPPPQPQPSSPFAPIATLASSAAFAAPPSMATPAAVPPPDQKQINASNYNRLLQKTRAEFTAITTNQNANWVRRIADAQVQLPSVGYFSRQSLKNRLDKSVNEIRQVAFAHRQFLQYLDEEEINLSSRRELQAAEYDELREKIARKARELFALRTAADERLAAVRRDLFSKLGQYTPD